MYTPRDKDIEEAKEYLRERVRAELSMTRNLDMYLLDAARKMVALAKSFNIPPTLFSFTYRYELVYGINEIVSELIANIESACYDLCKYTDKEDDDNILSYVGRDINGDTFDERVTRYTSTFKDEMEEFIKIGLVSGALSWFTSWKGFSHDGLSSRNLLNRLTTNTIADAWMWADEEDMKRNGAIGFVSLRGSSYPCSYCDDMVGFHHFGEERPPYHPNCRCYIVPIYI